jgi:LuxR family maltose regulon positive regulatory protein
MAMATSTLLVSRPALMDLLERGTAGPVTVVASSAGSGKTLLVRSWLQVYARERPAAWVSVERDEHDAQRFWSTLISEVCDAAPTGVRIEALAPAPTFDGQAVVQRLVAELGVLGFPLIIVIDDLHELAAADARLQLTSFLDRLPVNVHVVLISRRDPQLGLHRRRLAGELTEIRSADLRFTLPEAGELLSGLGISVSPESLIRLHDRTEGWAAGLRLAAMSLAAHPDPDGFVAEFSGSERTVAEYLLAEVLEGQPADVRRLLMRTSLLERVNGPLGDLLTGDSGTERELQALADAGGFVVALDVSRTWFRFHHLFSDLLSVELRNTEPDAIAHLHSLAATWFAEHGFVIEAISHADAAGEDQQAAGLLMEHYFSLTLDGREATARALLARLHPAAVAVSPELAVVLAAEQLVDGSLDQAAAHLALADRQRAAVRDDRRQRFEMARLVTRLSLTRRLGDFRSVLDEVSATVTAEDSPNGESVSIDGDVRALALMNLGIVEVWSGRVVEGGVHLEEARELAGRIGRPYLLVECQAHLAQVTAWRSFTRAGVASREVIEHAERLGWGNDPVVAPALVTLGASLLQAGRFEEAGHWLSRADQILHSDLEPAVGFQLHLAMGGLHLACGRPADAIASLSDAERLSVLLVSGSPLARQLQSSMLRARLAMGETTAVRDTLANMRGADREAGEIREVFAGLALADGNAEAALAELAPTVSSGPDTHQSVVLVRSLILEALARDALGDTAASEAAIERALEIAEPDTLILPFAHVPSRELLERHPRHRTSHGALITLIIDVISGQTQPPVRSPSAPLLDPLSDAELRVLRFLPTNLPAGEIAGQLYVSVHTVKTHLRHIYVKLDVHTRAEAVSRAREVGLIGQTRSRT